MSAESERKLEQEKMQVLIKQMFPQAPPLMKNHMNRDMSANVGNLR